VKKRKIKAVTTFDRETDRRTEFSSQDRVCIPCSAVIIMVVSANMTDRSDVQGHSRSSRSVSIESPYATSY